MSESQKAIDAAIKAAQAELSGALWARLAWRFVALVAALLVCLFLLDRWFEPTASTRFVIELMLLMFCTMVFVRWAIAARRPIPRSSVAAAIGGRLSEGPQLLLSAVTADATADPQLLEITRRQAAQQIERRGGVSLCRPAWRTRAACLTGLLLMLIVGYAVLRPDLVGVYCQRLALAQVTYPRSVRLVLDRAESLNEQGEYLLHTPTGEPTDLLVRCDLTPPYRAPGRVRATVRSPMRKRLELVQIGEVTSWFDPTTSEDVDTLLYRLRLDRITEPLQVSIRGGDCQMPSVRVVPTARPSIIDARLVVSPPSYLRHDSFDTSANQIEAIPEGSSVSLSFTASRPVRSASVSRGDPETEIGEVVIEEAAVITPQLVMSSDNLVRVELVDELGLSIEEPFGVNVPVTHDQPPTVEAQLKGVGDRVTSTARVVVAIQVSDDYPLIEAELIASLDSGEQLYRSPLTSQGKDSIDTEIRIDLGGLKDRLHEGDKVAITLTARDAYDIGPREASQSEPLFLRIVAPEELLALLGDREARIGEELLSLAEDLDRLAYRLLRSAGNQEPEFITELSDARRAAAGVERAIAELRSLVVEAVNNRLDQPSLLDRWRQNVIRPLRTTRNGNLSDLIERLEASSTEAAGLAKSSAEEVRAVAQQIAERESYQQLVARLRTLIREQRRINQITSEEQQTIGSRLLFD